MDTKKKSTRASLENKRSLFFQLGLLLAIAVAFAAFEWRTASQPERITITSVATALEPIDIPLIREVRETPPPPPAPSLDLEVVPNDMSLEGIATEIDIDFEPVNLSVPDYHYTDRVVIGEVPDTVPTLNPGDLDEQPDPRGFIDYVRKNLRYPPLAAQNGIYGTVHVQFVIDRDGSISNAQVVRGVDPLLDAEALRLFNSNPPKWKPGKQNGHPVRVKYFFPIAFRLQ